jgi:hypothetical protein
MNNEFKKIVGKNQTIYTLESASGGGTSSGNIASVSTALGSMQRRNPPSDNILAQEADKTKEAPKPRNFVAKNAKMGGAGQHKDKKKAEKQGDVKHKNKDMAEGFPKDPNAPKLVQDRKTGKWYDPNKEFEKKMNSPEVMAQMKRMAQKEGVAGQHKDKKKAEKQGDVKHKNKDMDMAEGYDDNEEEFIPQIYATVIPGTKSFLITKVLDVNLGLKVGDKVSHIALTRGKFKDIPKSLSFKQGVAEGFGDMVRNVGQYFMSQGATKFVDLLDSGKSPVAIAVHISQMSPRQQDDIRKAISHYLEKNPHAKLQRLLDMISKQGVAEGLEDKVVFQGRTIGHIETDSDGDPVGIVYSNNPQSKRPFEIYGYTNVNRLKQEMISQWNMRVPKGVTEDHEIQMASSELQSIAKNAESLLDMVRRYSEQDGLQAWQQSKITKAADYLNSVLQSVSGEQSDRTSEDHSDMGRGFGKNGYRTAQAQKIQPDAGNVPVAEDEYMAELFNKLAEKIPANAPADVWVKDFQKANPNKYHQFKNKTPEKKAQMAVAASYAAKNPSKK